MVKYREILRQRAMGISIRNIAFSCGCSTATVVTVVDRAKARGLEWPLPEEMNDAAIRAVIYPREPKSDASKAEIDHERVDREMLEQACAKALSYSPRPSCKTVKSIASKMAESVPEDPDDGAYLRGSGYYQNLDREDAEGDDE